jgi:putative salt-induced outer membrane protein
MRCTLLATLLAASLAAPLAMAGKETRPWKASAELGAIATSGNTDTTTIQGKIEADQNTPNWSNRYTLGVLFKEDQIQGEDGSTTTVKTAERVSLSARGGYRLTREHSTLFVYGSHVNDQFAAYSAYTTVSVGYGARVYDGLRAQLEVEIGPGYYWADQRLSDGSTVAESSVIGRGALTYDWQWTDNADFRQVLSVESGPDNTRTTSDTSLSTRINSALKMKVGFNLTNDTDVAPGKVHTDTTTYVNLVYSF